MRSLLNPWALIGILLMAAGSFFYGTHVGSNAEIAKHARDMALEQRVELAVAKGVSGLKVHNTTIRQNLETITREVPVYIDCHHDPRVLGLLNDLLTGKTALAPGDRLVPAAGTPR